MDKLLHLMRYNPIFILDDSSSMNMNSDVYQSQAMSDQIKRKITAPSQGESVQGGPSHKRKKIDRLLSRWEEMEDRIHTLIDIMSYIPIKQIQFTFLNKADSIILQRENKTPEEFKAYAHSEISKVFQSPPSGQTPMYEKLKGAFNQGNETAPVMIYLMTDGCPNKGPLDTIEHVSRLIINRSNPQFSPLNILGCGEERDLEWTTKVDDLAPFVAQLDDYDSELREVQAKQGRGLPFSRGFWLVNQLVAAINPHDLDAMDEDRPFSKFTLDNLLGYTLSKEDYLSYWYQNPLHDHYQSHFTRLSTEASHSEKILNAGGLYNMLNSAGLWLFNQLEHPQNASGTSHSSSSSVNPNPLVSYGYGYPIAVAHAVSSVRPEDGQNESGLRGASSSRPHSHR